MTMENDLSHLIEPLEETILKVKELNKGKKIKGEFNSQSETNDIQMACSCNDWGPDKLGPDGKWVCENCGTKCFCDHMWGSCTHLTHKGSKKSPVQTKEKIDENLNKIPQKDNSIKCNPCVCGVLRKTDSKNKIEKIKSDERTSKEALIQSTSGTEVTPCTYKIESFAIHIKNIQCTPLSKKQDFDKEKDVSVLYEKKQKTGGKMPTKEVQVGSLKRDTYCAKKRKCVSCSCTYDEKGNKIKSEECRAASDRKKKLMANLEREKHAIVEDENRDCQIDTNKSIEIKISLSTDNCGKGTSSHASAFEKKGKCSSVTSKSSSTGLLTSYEDLKRKRCCDGVEESCFERPEREKYEKPEKPLQCSEMSGRKTDQKSDESTRKGRSKPPCNKCPQGIKKSGDSESSSPGSESDEPARNLGISKPNCNKCLPEGKSPRDKEKFSSVSEIDEPIKKFKRNKSPCKQCPPKTKTAEDKTTCSSGSEKVERENKIPPKLTSISSTRKGKSQDQNFQNKPCDYCKSAKSDEKLCPCGCGYFIEGVPADSYCPCSNTSKVPQQKKQIGSAKSLTKRTKTDCEGDCKWCHKQ